jgi:hypothetical protein
MTEYPGFEKALRSVERGETDGIVVASMDVLEVHEVVRILELGGEVAFAEEHVLLTGQVKRGASGVTPARDFADAWAAYADDRPLDLGDHGELDPAGEITWNDDERRRNEDDDQDQTASIEDRDRMP